MRASSAQALPSAGLSATCLASWLRKAGRRSAVSGPSRLAKAPALSMAPGLPILRIDDERRERDEDGGREGRGPRRPHRGHAGGFVELHLGAARELRAGAVALGGRKDAGGAVALQLGPGCAQGGEVRLPRLAWTGSRRGKTSRAATKATAAAVIPPATIQKPSIREPTRYFGAAGAGAGAGAGAAATVRFFAVASSRILMASCEITMPLLIESSASFGLWK